MHFNSNHYGPLSFDRPEPLNHVPKDTQVTAVATSDKFWSAADRSSGSRTRLGNVRESQHIDLPPHGYNHAQVTDPLEGRYECHIAPAEWRLLGYLEREGFAHDTFAETQLHFGELKLDEYKVCRETILLSPCANAFRLKPASPPFQEFAQNLRC